MQIGDTVVITGTVVERQPGNGNDFVLTVDIGDGHHPVVVRESLVDTNQPAKPKAAKKAAKSPQASEVTE